MCRWEEILREGTEEQIYLMRDIDRLRGKAMRGDPVRAVLKKRERKLRETK